MISERRHREVLAELAATSARETRLFAALSAVSIDLEVALDHGDFDRCPKFAALVRSDLLHALSVLRGGLASGERAGRDAQAAAAWDAAQDVGGAS